MADFGVVLDWKDDQADEVRMGDGISRAMPGVPVEWFTLSVAQAGTGPMRVRLQAEDAARAILYGKARWPHALVTLSAEPLSIT